MAGFEHFTETFSKYNFHYHSIPVQPYAWFSPGQTINHYFLQLHVPNPQHGPKQCLSFSKLHNFNSDMLLVHHSYGTKKAENHFIRTTNFMLLAEPFGLLMLKHFLLAYISQNKAIVVTMATWCNSHQQYSAEFQRLLPWSIPFPAQNFLLFLARWIKLASSIYCHTFKIVPRIQDGL